MKKNQDEVHWLTEKQLASSSWLNCAEAAREEIKVLESRPNKNPLLAKDSKHNVYRYVKSVEIGSTRKSFSAEVRAKAELTADQYETVRDAMAPLQLKTSSENEQPKKRNEQPKTVNKRLKKETHEDGPTPEEKTQRGGRCLRHREAHRQDIR